MTIGNNVSLEVKGDILTITVDISKEFGPSKSGKTTVIASTLGNVSLPAPNGEVKIGLNVYKPVK
jgi:hypothetical protein